MCKTTDLWCCYRMQTLKQKAEALAVMLVFEISDVTTTDNESCDGSPAKYTMDPNYKYKTILCYPQVLTLICLIVN